MSPALLVEDGGCGADGGQGPKKLTFPELVLSIRQYLSSASGTNSAGLDSCDVDPEVLKGLMARYESDPKDWADMARAIPSKNYSRNLVDSINRRSNLLILVWNPGKSSPIHDHANSHCVMKVLQGSLREEIFEEPPSPSDERSELLVKSDRIYEPNSVTYICDNLGIHRITNPNDEPAISLHLYTPPNAADFGFNIFDRTGKASYVQSAGADFTHVPCA